MSAAPLHPQIRLALLRSRLSLALHHLQAGQGQAAASQGAHPDWWNSLRAEPGTRVLLDTLAAWWAQQPWHQTAALLAESAKHLLRPVAQRNPLLLVVGAAVLGGALVLLKPWRWISVPTLAASLLSQFMARS